MTARAALLFAVMGLLLSASLALAASVAPAAPPAASPAAALPPMSLSTPAAVCLAPAQGLSSFLSAPQAAPSGGCGACSDESCEGLFPFASCGPAGFRCLAQGTCGGGNPRCKCLLI